MDKPVSLSVKDFLIRKLAIKMLTPEKTIEAVVHHQFSSANEAITKTVNKSVEVSGFGKFIFNDKKAIKKMDNLLKIEQHLIDIINGSPSEQRRKTAYAKLEDLRKAIEILKPKIDNEPVTNNGGVEEQPHTASQAETDDKGDEQG